MLCLGIVIVEWKETGLERGRITDEYSGTEIVGL